jgi:hypothetical protein
VDYSAIPDSVLVKAGEDVCTQLRSDGTPDGGDLEREQYRIRDRYPLDRASIDPALVDPRDPAGGRNADLRVAGAVATAALQQLCPELPFDPSS